MVYVGLDIYTRHISVCALNEKGQLVHRSQVRSIEEMLRVLQGLPDRFEVDLPIQEQERSQRRRAASEAPVLGETPTVHVASLEVRTWPELINCRSQVIAKRTRAKNTVRALLRSAGVVRAALTRR